MASLFARTNDAIAVNPDPAGLADTTVGSDWLWAVFAVMLTVGFGVTGWGFSKPQGQRTFHFLGVAILFTASIAYFTLASNLGSTPIVVEFARNGELAGSTRSIYYVRYIDWVITTPLLLLTLLLGTGLPLSQIFITIFMDEVMIITGLIGALVRSSYKWGYFTFGCIALFYVIWILVGPAREAARALGDDNHRAYIRGALVLSFLWFLYPVAWGLCEGGNVISVTSEMWFYGWLDVCAKPGFIIVHLLALKNIDYDRFGLQSGHFTVGQQVATAAQAEKGQARGTSHDTFVGGHQHGDKAAAPLASQGLTTTGNGHPNTTVAA